MLLRFERAVDKNQDQRSKYPNDPTKYVLYNSNLVITHLSVRFIDSEAELDSAIKALLPLSQAPVLAYPELVKSGAVEKLINLMSHENTDIMIDVVQLVNELIDEEAGAENEDEEDETDRRESTIKSLIDTLVCPAECVSCQCFSLLSCVAGILYTGAIGGQSTSAK